ncbi:hypothetical protein DFP92_102337 [Yoonia sediminilitoris]|uniref:Uncharacterized protein n=1 Tax=Yoonia sediminilitoris TaxID=1286148 RepID=A0A2T6KM86_9RHOB|nr:hypothetical protein C8N45_102337 [Yoonia sediminilitoris]RCW97620.1 hypothetical protein DFP92_102337 [Yoonia sediminilitoris]
MPYRADVPASHRNCSIHKTRGIFSRRRVGRCEPSELLFAPLCLRRPIPPDGRGKLCTKFINALPDRFLARDDAARRKLILDIAQAHGKPKTGPDRIGNDIRRETVAFEGAGMFGCFMARETASSFSGQDTDCSTWIIFLIRLNWFHGAGYFSLRAKGRRWRWRCH